MIPLVAVALVTLPAQPADVPWPAPEWPAAPDAALDRALAAAFSARIAGIEARTHAVVVVRGGRIVGERYAPGFDAGSVHGGWSATKSLGHALAGLLAADGRLRADEPAPVPAWAGPDDGRRAISPAHLLSMTSGLSWAEDYVSPLSSDVLAMLFGRGRRDMAAYAEGRPLAHPPGTTFTYSSGSSLVLSGVLRRAAGSDEAYRALPRRLFERLGMTSARLEADGAGTYVLSSYGYATARDWARLGLLYLRDGVWAGGRVLPPGWVDRARTPAGPSRGAYGSGFWLRQGAAAAPGVPADAFAAQGKGGNLVAIVPSRDLVVVRLGTTPGEPRPLFDALLADVCAASGAQPR